MELTAEFKKHFEDTYPAIVADIRAGTEGPNERWLLQATSVAFEAGRKLEQDRHAAEQAKKAQQLQWES